MKTSKFVIIVSELWNDEQISLSKACLLKGLELINKSVVCDNILHDIDNCDIGTSESFQLENCDVEVILKADKARVVHAINGSLKFDNSLILYVGEVTIPFGSWILCDGLFSSLNLLDLIQNGDRKDNNNCVLVTLSPCEDWQLMEKKQLRSFTLSPYMPDDNIEDNAAIGKFVDKISEKLTISLPDHADSSASATIVTRQPALYAFLDRGSPVVPAMLALDGFVLLLSCGAHRRASWRRYLSFYQQIDVVLLTHVGYNSVLGLDTLSSALIPRIGHIFLPPCDPYTGVSPISSCSLHVDLRSQLGDAVARLKERGAQWSHLGVKARLGSAVAATNMKPMQLFHKIGYGCLEMIPLTPFEDEAELKKFTDEWKKGKYANDNVLKNLPSSVTALIVWKPFSSKCAIKRVLYVGWKCSVKKYLSALLSTLYSTYDYLKQSDFVPSDGLVKKTPPRKAATPPIGPATAVASTKSTKSDLATASVPASASTRKTTAEKTNRPSTATPAHGQKPDETSKRPQTAGPKQQPPPTSKATAAADTGKKSQSATAATSKPGTKSAAAPPNKKVPSTKKIDSSNAGKNQSAATVAAPSKQVQKLLQTKKAPATKAEPTKGADVVINTAVIDSVANGKDAPMVVGNGDCQPPVLGSDPLRLDEHHNDDDDVLPDDTALGDTEVSKIVAVGTVECAITEHGEADFCDETPEELSLDQMREMGLYDDDEEERARSGHGAGAGSQSGDSGAGVGNIAHLSMENSFYGKESIDGSNIDGDRLGQWSQPLAMPMPVKASGDAISSATVKKGGKCSTQIHVDCICVPCDLDKDDLRFLFECVRFRTAFCQVERSEDLIKCLEILVEEREAAPGSGESTVIPSLADESLIAWLSENQKRLDTSQVKVPTDLAHCQIGAGSDGVGTADTICQGMKLEL